MRLSDSFDPSVCFLSGSATAGLLNPEHDFDVTAWELLCSWRQQHGDRLGAGTSSPAIPQSQRQYDGDNHFDYCEVLVLR